MNAADKQTLRRRAQRILAMPIPDFARNGTALQGHLYRDDAAALAAFVRRGVSAEKALLAASRIEGLCCAAAADEKRSAAAAAAPVVHTPPSNTGVNEVGSGRGLVRGYLKAAQRVETLWTRLEKTL